MDTKRPLIKLTLLLIILLSLVNPVAAQQTEYTISHYEVTFVLVPDNEGELRDAAVTLLVTYDVTKGPKSSGSKFIGKLPVKNVSVTDGNGKPLNFTVEELKENKITWHFQSFGRGKQTVIAHFTLVGALEGTLEQNSLHFDWVKNWKIPVYNATYRFILPDDYVYDSLQTEPAEGQLVSYHGRRAIEVYLSQLSDQPFSVQFSPGVAEAKFSLSGILSSLTSLISMPVLIIIGVIATIFGFSRMAAKNSKGHRRQSRSQSSYGCSGCSSCSSCSSCGGCGD